MTPKLTTAQKMLRFLHKHGPSSCYAIGTLISNRRGETASPHGGGDYAAQMLLGRARKLGLVHVATCENQSKWELTPAGLAVAQKLESIGTIRVPHASGAINFLDPSLPERFWSKCIPEPNSNCWLWLASLRDAKEGYGGFQIMTGMNRRAHQVAYEALVGEVPNGLELDHKCRMRICCNPAHLEPVTKRVNILRGEGLAAQAAQRTHCKAGHAYTEENTYVRIRRGRSARVCRQCKNTHERQARSLKTP